MMAMKQVGWESSLPEQFLWGANVQLGFNPRVAIHIGGFRS